MRWVVACLLTIGLAFSAQASDPPAYVTAFRAFNAAIDAGDLAAADREGAAALAAAETALGDSKTTAILAANLAGLRLQMGQREAAAAPLARAQALAAKGVEGAPPATLTFLRAWADFDPKSRGARRALLAQLEADGDDQVAWRYAAAIQLSAASMANEDWTALIASARLEQALADGAPFEPASAQAMGVVREGFGLLQSQALPTALKKIYPRVGEASRTLLRAADGTPKDGVVPPSLKAWGESIAVHRALAAGIEIDGDVAPEDATLETAASKPEWAQGRCKVDIKPDIVFPTFALRRAIYGSVVALYELDPTGKVSNVVSLAGDTPDNLFWASTEAAIRKAPIEIKRDGASKCRVEGWRLIVVSYRLKVRQTPVASRNARRPPP